MNELNATVLVTAVAGTPLQSLSTPGMAHTYGEVLAQSYPQIFEHMRTEGGNSAILDIGSGYAGILFAAVQQHDCIAVGIGSAPPLPFPVTRTVPSRFARSPSIHAVPL